MNIQFALMEANKILAKNNIKSYKLDSEILLSKILNKDRKFIILNLDKSLKLIDTLSPKKAILTNLHSDLDYNELKKKLKKNIVPAYDGMKINL